MDTNENNHGNFMLEAMWKWLKNPSVRVDIASKLGLPNLNKQTAVQIIQDILDSGITDLTAKEALECLVSDYRLDVDKGKNVKATQKQGLTYDLQEAQGIIAGISDPDVFDQVSDAFNYLDLVDGNCLGTDSPDALYFNSTKKMATLDDLRKEYQNGIKCLREICA